MEDSDHLKKGNIANQRFLANIAVCWILTIDPYIGRALCRTPLIGGLAGIQTLVFSSDSVNMEGPILCWYYNTWRWSNQKMSAKRAAALCIFMVLFIPDPCDRVCSSLYHVIVGGGMPSEGQLRITELLTLTMQSVRLLSSTGGAKTKRRNRQHEWNEISSMCCYLLYCPLSSVCTAFVVQWIF